MQVCLVDAYDVLLSPAAAELGERFLALEEETGKSVLFAAERTLWPDAALGALYPPSQPTLRKNEGNSGDSSSDSSSSSGVAHPLRFLNSGTVVGRAWALKYVLESVGVLGALSACGPDDQRAFHTVMLQHPQLIGLDYDGVVFQTLHFLTSPLAVESNGQVVVAVDGNGNGDDENDVDGNGRYSSKLSRVQRQEWQKRPCAVHGNGGDGKPAFARLVSGWQAALAAGDANEAAEGGSTNTVRDAQHSSRSSSKTAAAAAAVSVEPPPFSSGIAFYQAGDLNRAEVAFRKALASPLEPAQQIDSAYNLGVVLTELGKLGEAEEVYHQHALRLNPTHEGSLLNAAALRSHAGDGVGANALLDRCLRAHPDSNEARQLQAKFREGPF
jgi:TolA-binding protein